MTATLDYIVTTGDYIAEWMEGEGINAAELARRLGATPKHVSELLSGKAPLSHATSLALARVTGVPARIWNLYESGYRSAVASTTADEALADQYDAAQQFPLAYLRKYGVIRSPARDRAGTVRELVSFLGVASLDAFRTTWEHGSVAYRRSAVGRDNAPALAAWLRLAEQHHDGVLDVPRFDRPALESLIGDLRALTRLEPLAGLKQAVQNLRAVGVVLCVTPPVPGLGIHGATRWVNDHPVIQLSLLMKSDDQWWFTLFHELGHVILHGDKGLYLSGDRNEAEDEANRYASEVLIPPSYLGRLPSSRDVGAVNALADELGIAPSIVLGQVQRMTRDYAWGHQLKRRVEWVRSGTGG
ncbi:MAG: ImmA/IrrE family metallo-endopeptidase [Dermatophilaceae bacterium]